MTLEAWSVLARLHGFEIQQTRSGKATIAAVGGSNKNLNWVGAWAAEDDYVLYRSIESSAPIVESENRKIVI